MRAIRVMVFGVALLTGLFATAAVAVAQAEQSQLGGKLDRKSVV